VKIRNTIQRSPTRCGAGSRRGEQYKCSLYKCAVSFGGNMGETNCLPARSPLPSQTPTPPARSKWAIST
jgi:hypothetical protein